MNLKNTINFKSLRDGGPSSVDLKDDEVIQLIGRDAQVKVILTQEYFLTLLGAYQNVLIKNGIKEEKTVNIEEKLNSFEKKMLRLFELSQRDQDESEIECKTTGKTVGRNAAGNY